MERIVRRIRVGDGSGEKVIVKILDIDSSGPEIPRRQFQFLKDVVIDGEVNFALYAGRLPFEKLEMTHDGSRWVIKIEATEV